MGTKIGVPIAQGLDVPNFFKDVPNFVNDVPNFVKDVLNFVNDVPRVPKSVPMWGTTSNHFPMVSKRNKWTMGREIGVPLAQGLYVSKFLKDVPRVPMFIPRWRMTSNHFPRVPKGTNRPWEG